MLVDWALMARSKYQKLWKLVLGEWVPFQPEGEYVERLLAHALD